MAAALYVESLHVRDDRAFVSERVQWKTRSSHWNLSEMGGAQAVEMKVWRILIVLEEEISVQFKMRFNYSWIFRNVGGGEIGSEGTKVFVVAALKNHGKAQ